VFLKDFNDFAAMNAVYGAYLARKALLLRRGRRSKCPACPKDVLVEIDLIAESLKTAFVTVIRLLASNRSEANVGFENWAPKLGSKTELEDRA